MIARNKDERHDLALIVDKFSTRAIPSLSKRKLQ